MATTEKEKQQTGKYDIITVFGAKGKVGIELLRYLSRKGIYCRAITRDLKNTIPLPYVTWMGGDLMDEPGIYNLVAGSTGLFLNTDFSLNMAEMKENVIASAKSAGVKHIAYLTGPFSDPPALCKAG